MRKLLALAIAVPTALFALPAPVMADPYRPFSEESYWNTRIPSDAPRDPDSNEIIDFLKADNDYNYVRMLGVDNDMAAWGKPIYWAGAGDTEYDVVETGLVLPPELDSLRIPEGARPADTSDSDMVVYDLGKGYVVNLWHASYSATRDRWYAEAGSVYHVRSNGLHGFLPQSDDARNYGHRGIPGSIMSVRWGEAQAEKIDHVLELFVNRTACRYVFPMVEDECAGSSMAGAPPEGTLMRIKQSVELAELGLSPVALAIARALKRYGAVIGDQSGANVTLRVENTLRQGLGQKWTEDVLTADALSEIPLDKWEVIKLGWTKPSSPPDGGVASRPGGLAQGVVSSGR